MAAFRVFRLGHWAAVREFRVEKLQRDSTNTCGTAFIGGGGQGREEKGPLPRWKPPAEVHKGGVLERNQRPVLSLFPV